MLSAKGFEMEHMCLRALCLSVFCLFFEVVGLNSPYLGSFNFCGLKNLILPSFSVSIRWPYGCSAEGKQYNYNSSLCVSSIGFVFFRASMSACRLAKFALTNKLRPVK